MAFDTKPNLNDNKFEQFSGETLSLSGCTDIYGDFVIKPDASFILADNTQGDGYLMQSDASGKGTWSNIVPLTTANNGLCANGGVVSMGGTLTGNTTIAAGSNIFTLSGANETHIQITDQFSVIQGIDLRAGGGSNASIGMIGSSVGASNITSCAGIDGVPTKASIFQDAGAAGCARLQLVVSYSSNTKQQLELCSCDDAVFTDEVSCKGFVYAEDYSTAGEVDPRWIPDAAWVTGQTPSVSASGENITVEVTQATHGFAVKDFIGWSGGTYNKAIADGNYDGEFIGIVSEVPDANTFKVTQSGFISGLTSLVNNTTYWLSPTTAGLISDTEPSTDGQISKAVLVANSTTSGWVVPYAGFVVSSGSSVGVTAADNGLTLNGSTMELGGTLCKNTVISNAGNNLCVWDNSIANSSMLTEFTASCVRIHATCTSPLTHCHRFSISEGAGIKSEFYCAGDCYAAQTISSVGIITTLVGLGYKVTDTRATPHGIQYNGCISTGFTSNCSLVDKGYVDDCVGAGGCGLYSSNSPATKTVGGITAGAVLTGQTLEYLLQEILAPYIEPAFSSFLMTQTTPLEVGDPFSGSKNFSWAASTSANIASSSIGIRDITSGTTIATGFDYGDTPELVNIGTKVNTSPKTWTWQVTGCSTNGTPISRNVSKCSVYPYYWGVVTCATRPAVDNTLVNSGTKVHTCNSCSTVCVDFNSVAQWTWVAIPTNNPSTVPIKTCWYITPLSNSTMGNPGDKYPDVCTLNITSGDGCWSTVSYKVYMSNLAGSDADIIQFRNS